MIKRIKKLSQLKGKKRYIVLGFLAVELMSLPAAAHIVHSAAVQAIQVQPVVTAVEVPTQKPGLSRFLVMSNAGFGVQANNVSGEVSVKIKPKGVLNNVSRYGGAAQLPGPQETCAQTSNANTSIYIADRKTAAREGTAPQRAVIFEISYDPAAQPKFEFIAGSDKIATIATCSSA